MFDTMEIAKRIKQARINKNMTQMNLADAMGVSYQAVSNWERGNSMPDISKLADLCQTLGMTVNELLGMEEPAAVAVTKAMEKEELTVEELKEVAPMLPPEEVKEQVEKTVRKWDEDFEKNMEEMNRRISTKMEDLSRRLAQRFGTKQPAEEKQQAEEKRKKRIDLSAVAELAPFLDEEYLNSLVLDADLTDLDGLDDLAPFLSNETLCAIAERADVGDMDVLVDIAPFLDKDTIDMLICRCIREDEGDLVGEFAPFAAKESLEELVDTLIAQKADFEDLDWDVSDLYPFLSKPTLLKLAKYLLEQGQSDPLDDVKDYL